MKSPATVTMCIVLFAFAPAAIAQPIAVNSYQKIGEGLAGFSGDLEDDDIFGRVAAGIGDIDSDGIPDLAVGAQGDDDGGTDRGSVWILRLNADGTAKAQQKISSTEGGLAGPLTNGGQFGSAVAGVGDIDGDSIADLLVGALINDNGSTGTGAVWVVFLNADGTVKADQKIANNVGGLPAVLNPTDRFGCGAAALGDLDGDGVADAIVGARLDDDGGSNRGAIHVLFLNADGTVKSHQKISALAGGFAGTLQNGDTFGTDVATLGDVDGDDVTDILVGASESDDGGVNAGSVWVVFLNSDGTVKGQQKIAEGIGGFSGLEADDSFGSHVGGPGDLDGDGVPDAVVGAPGDDEGGADAGAVWILFLNANGTVKGQQRVTEGTSNFSGTIADGDAFATGLGIVGDIKGLGLPAITVGAVGDDTGCTSGCGALYLLFLELPACGNGEVEPFERCDLGNQNGAPGSLCDTNCQPIGCCVSSCDPPPEGPPENLCSSASQCGSEGCCGDGILDSGEQCDDGNRLSGDCCSIACETESPSLCVSPCENVFGPHLFGASMKLKLSDRNDDMLMERWSIGRKGSLGDFNLLPGQSLDCTTEMVRIVITQNGAPTLLGSFALDPAIPGVWTTERVRDLDDETCKLSDKAETLSTPDGVGKAQIGEKGTKVKYKFRGSTLAQIITPTPGTLLRACIHVGDDAGTALLACKTNSSGSSVKCESVN